MKTQIHYKSAVLMVLFCAAISLISCEKDDVDENGTARLKVVNASQTSGTQNFYLLNSVLTTGLGYSGASDYISTNSGNRLSASFRNAGTDADYAKGELWMGNSKSYTVYLVGEGSDARVKLYEDNLSTPSSGKARVKFIHLSDGAPSDIRIKDASGNELVNNISRNIESGYKAVSPGKLTFSIIGTASGNTIGNFDIPLIVEGKIYAVYITGSSISTLRADKVEY